MTFVPTTEFPARYFTEDGKYATVEIALEDGTLRGWIRSADRGRSRRIAAFWNADGTHWYYKDGRAHPNNLVGEPQ